MWFGLFPFRSPLLGESHLLSLPPGTEMVHFPGFASHSLLYSGVDIPILLRIRLKDSEIPRSQPVCGSLRLIAAYHVLPRLPSPRHPPCALSSLTIKFTLNTECSRRATSASAGFAAHGDELVLYVARQYSVVKDRTSPEFRSQKTAVGDGRLLVSESYVVGLGRVELPTSPLSGVRSSHLSYRPRSLPPSTGPAGGGPPCS